jgi:hypothetical protein
MAAGGLGKLLPRPDTSTRVCFMVSRVLDIGPWVCRTDHANIASPFRRHQTDRGPVDITNVYNPKRIQPEAGHPRSRAASPMPNSSRSFGRSLSGSSCLSKASSLTVRHSSLSAALRVTSSQRKPAYPRALPCPQCFSYSSPASSTRNVQQQCGRSRVRRR